MAPRVYTADTPAQAEATVRRVNTLIAEGAARLMATDPRITPRGAVFALAREYMHKLADERPHVPATYVRALGRLGIIANQMSYEEFLRYVRSDVRLRLHTDRKVAG